jgi:hypothetical protein
MADFAKAAQNLNDPAFKAAQARGELDKTAEGQFWGDVSKGEDWANKHFAEGSMGRINDPRQAEINALLAQQKAGMSTDAYATGAFGTAIDPRAAEAQQYLAKLQAGMQGMTPDEMRAAREQGEADINRQLAINLQRMSGIAASNGVRGGAGAALSQRAISDAQTQSGDLARKLILDNLAQRNLGTQMYGQALGQQQATELGIQDRNLTARQAELVGNLGQKNLMGERYGNTLSEQQGRELGIQQENLGAQRQELFGRTSTPFQIASALDAARSGARADELSREQLDIAKQYVKQFGQTGGFSGKPGSQFSSEEVSAAKKTISDANASAEDKRAAADIVAQDFGQSEAKKKGLTPKDYDFWNPITTDKNGNASYDTGPRTTTSIASQKDAAEHGGPSNMIRDGVTYIRDLPKGVNAAEVQNKYKDPTTGLTYYDMTSLSPTGKEQAKKAAGGTIVCSEACAQGFITPDERSAMSEHGLRTMSLSEFKAYWAWATPVVFKMRKSKFVAKIMGRIVRSMVKDLRAGHAEQSISWRTFHFINRLVMRYRSLRLKQHGKTVKIAA